MTVRPPSSTSAPSKGSRLAGQRGVQRPAGRPTEKPAGAWTPDPVIDVLLDGLAAGDFYVLCPDNEVTRDVDERRIQWAADDIILNRPALSRWHPDYAAEFPAFAGTHRPTRPT